MSEKMKIVIATAEVNRDAVEEILRKLTMLTGATVTPQVCTEAASEPEPKQTPETPKACTPAPEVKEVSIQDLRTKVIELSQVGKKKDAAKIIHEYAEKVPQIPEDKRAEVMDRLLELEAV